MPRATETSLLDLVQRRAEDPQNLDLRDQEHAALSRQIGKRFGPSLGPKVIGAAVPAYSAYKGAAQSMGMMKDATPASLREVGAGLSPLLGGATLAQAQSRPQKDPLYGDVEVMTPEGLQATGLAPKTQGPLAPKQPSPSRDLSALITGKPTREQQIRESLYPTKGLPMVIDRLAKVGMSLAAPNPASFLGRLGVQTAVSGLEGSLQGQSPKDIGTRMGLGGLLQAGAEGVIGLAGLPFKARAASKALAEYRTAMKTYSEKKAFDESMTNALNTMEQAGHKVQVKEIRDSFAEELKQARTRYKVNKHTGQQEYETKVAAQEATQAGQIAQHAEGAAKAIADDFKRQVPSWKNMPSDTKGLLDMVYGKGQKAVSESFDKAMKEVSKKGAGKDIPLPLQDIEALGLKTKRLIDTAEGQPKIGVVDAAEMAGAAVGRWSKDPGAYRRVVSALDKAGVGDPAARAEYKAAQSLIQFMDRTKALEGEVLRPDRLLSGMTSLKKIDELRRRGQGDIFSGPMQAARGGPLAPPEIPKPVVPPFIPPSKPQMPQAPRTRVNIPGPEPPAPDIGRTMNPFAKHPWVMGAGAEMGARGMGHGGFGLPFILGAAASEAIPKELITRAPLSEGTAKMLQNLPTLLSILGRQSLLSSAQ